MSFEDFSRTRRVLKLAPDLTEELAALQWFAGHGGVRVLASDPARGAALLEPLTRRP
jgi:streptomycin 6-kinase